MHPFPTDKRNIRARALGFAGFTGLANLYALFTRPRPDVVLAMSPPLPIGLAGLAVARLRRAPLVFNIQDIFPDVAVELGLLTNPTIIRAASYAERTTYAHSAAVTVLSDDLKANVEAKVQRAQAGRRWLVRRRVGNGGGRPDPPQVLVIPNFVDTERIRPADRENSYRKEFGLSGKTVVMYAGNVGLSQSLELLVAAARALKQRDDVAFVVNGGGSALDALKESARGLGNVVFAPYQPAERLSEVLAAADIHVVALKRGLAHASVPSKLYSILAAGRPIVASVDPGTEVVRIVEAAGAGRCVTPEDPAAFTAAILELIDAPGRCHTLGEAGRHFVETWVSSAGVAERYEALFEEICRRH